jgi:hypothetical protein
MREWAARYRSREEILYDKQRELHLNYMCEPSECPVCIELEQMAEYADEQLRKLNEVKTK